MNTYCHPIRAPWPRHPRLASAVLAAAVVLCAPLQASDVALSVSGNNAHASISMPLGVGADLSVSFSEVDNLSPANLSVQSARIGPLDPSVLSRLPALVNTLAGSFPMVVTIEPSAMGALEFADTVRVEMHTHNLQYTPGTRVRLFKAEQGGTFRDITEAVEPGSVRARGRTGGFSQFMLAMDLRPSSVVAAGKYDYLQDRFGDAVSVDGSSRSGLQSALADSRAAFESGDYQSAIASLDAFDHGVRQLSGSVIPNRWSAAGALDNIGGDLQAGVATLRFTLGYLRDHGN